MAGIGLDSGSATAQSPVSAAGPLFEPPARRMSFSAAAGGKHYIWGGNIDLNSLYCFDSLSELWSQKQTTGTRHPVLGAGPCVFHNGSLYMFGGVDKTSNYNTLSKLNPESAQWSQEPTSGDCPSKKCFCGLVEVDEKTLCCFGGMISALGKVKDSDNSDDSNENKDKVFNECHLFSTGEGIWSSPVIEGDKPPPCTGFSFTKVDQDRALLFGGRKGTVLLCDVYEFNFTSMILTKFEATPGELWLAGRGAHASCCLNFGEEHPQLLVFGGMDADKKTLRDMWLMDVNTHHWTQVPLPESVKGRKHHSLTATTLAPGLTEVLLFGGMLDDKNRTAVADTTIFRFERSSGSGQWTLVDVADNRTRASPQRLAEKRALIRGANIGHSSGVHSLEQQLRASEEREQTTQQLLEQRTQELGARARKLEDRARESEDRARESEDRVRESEDRVRELEDCVRESEDQAQELYQQLRTTQEELEGKTKELAAHNTEVWRIPSSRTSTIRTIGAGGWGEVMEGTVRVAMKKLHPAILTPHNLEKLRREMRLLAEVRHPNLVQFIGAVFDQTPPLIVTELLDMNLRQAYERNQLGPGHRLPIYIDLARALDYLHQRYEPIIHRDVSAPNVLLERMPGNQWKGKLSDLGSANFLKHAQTMGEGAIIYSPPEVIPRLRSEPAPQTVKIDVYSYGIVLCEVTTSRFPSQEHIRDMLTQVQRQHPRLHQLINSCTEENPSERPTMAQVLTALTALPPL